MSPMRLAHMKKAPSGWVRFALRIMFCDQSSPYHNPCKKQKTCNLIEAGESSPTYIPNHRLIDNPYGSKHCLRRYLDPERVYAFYQFHMNSIYTFPMDKKCILIDIFKFLYELLGMFLRSQLEALSTDPRI